MLKRIIVFYYFKCYDMEKGDWEKLIARLRERNVLHSDEIMRAMRLTPRKNFLPIDMQSYSAQDTPLPIGFGQTISAPHNQALLLG
jgi:protein-L-isoaspartate(D-aspartate) O-methyltransferase